MTTTDNPLLADFYFPPFHSLTADRFLPAIEQAVEESRRDIERIATQTVAPTFANTVETLERSGHTLDRVLGVFYPLLSANADERMMTDSIRVSELLSHLQSDTTSNPRLFSRIKAVHTHHSTPGAEPQLTVEQRQLLENTYLDFVRAGADLPEADREKLRLIRTELSRATTTFGLKVKKELARHSMLLTEEQTQGLPDTLKRTMAEAARTQGHTDGSYLLTLDQPVYMGFMKYSPLRGLREQLWRTYTGRNIVGENSTLSEINRIATLRLEMARLLGYRSFAHFKLERTMAETPEAVMNLLERLRTAYAPALQREMTELEQLAGHTIMPWDYSYYAEQLRRSQYDFNEEELRPYFELDSVIGGVFSLATRLYGLQFEPMEGVDTYHPDVKVYKVTDSADGSTLGALYADFFPRAGRKSPGAWMTEFREADGTVRPLVNIVMNFTKPTADTPSLLVPSEVNTLLHEFGHALHALLTRAGYQSLAGTNVYRDFVELPSQFNENYLTEPEFLAGFARHYLTGEPLPEALLQRMVAARQFGAAYACYRQLGFGYLDMAWHSITDPEEVSGNPAEFERRAMAPVQVLPTVEGSMVSPQFSHIFSGGYAAGYYSYKWAEVLDADAFSLFREKGIFNADVAASFRHCILERGGTEHPARLYERFRGRKATVDALLRRDGIIQ